MTNAAAAVNQRPMSVHGEAMGILAGDGLLNFAFETAALSAFRTLAPEELPGSPAALIQVLAGKPGVYGMLGGQVVDVEQSGEPMEDSSRSGWTLSTGLKTGALIRVHP